MLTWLTRLCATVAVLIVSTTAVAQTYPTKPIKLVVTFAPGGNADLIARVLAQPLGDVLGQPVVVDNRAGAGGTIGAAAVAQAAPDGYTLLFSASGPNAVAPSIYANLPYDPLRSFVHISRVSVQPSVIVVNPASGITDVAQLITRAKTSPNKLNFGSPGTGTTAHLAGELFKSLTGVDIVHVPYKEGRIAVTDLMEGRIQVLFDNVGQFLPFLKAGKLRAIAVIGDHRLSELPDVPTTVEAGLPQFQYTIWFGISAPANTPPSIVSVLTEKIAGALKQRAMREAMQKLNAETGLMSPPEFQDFIAADIARWAKVVKSAGIVAQ